VIPEERTVVEHRIWLGDVHAWYAEHGAGDPLVLLHPGGADARAWSPNLDALARHFRVLTPERRGHGRTPDVAGPITYDVMAQDTIAFLELVVGQPADLVGCSAGAVAALKVALARPDLRKLARMNAEEPTLRKRDLALIASRTMVMVADDDEILLDFLTNDPVETIAPVRRREVSAQEGSR